MTNSRRRRCRICKAEEGKQHRSGYSCSRYRATTTDTSLYTDTSSYGSSDTSSSSSSSCDSGSADAGSCG